MRTYYTDYVNHIIKTYVRANLDDLTSEPDRINWFVADRVIGGLTSEQQKILRAIYTELVNHDRTPMFQVVSDYCDRSGRRKEEVAWLIRTVQKKIKLERGL